MALPQGAALASDGPTVLEPSTSWNVDFAPTKCRLSRLFGSGDDQHLLFIEQSRPSDTFGLTVAGAEFERFRGRYRTHLQFFGEQTPHRTEPFKGNVGEFGEAMIYSSISLKSGDEAGAPDETGLAALPQLDPAFANQVEFVELKQGKRSVRLETGPLGEAFKVLNQCTQDMIREWGLDVEKHLTATKLPTWTNQSAVVRRIQATYPRQALRQGEQGIMRLRVTVDETGKVSDCVINNATIQDDLESPACREMRKAKFEPALDADRQPFKSYYANTITYRIG
ncbi:MAG: energy transducer TonB [Pseudomonadota bacterium]